MRHTVKRFALILTLALLLGCASSPVERSRELIASGQPEAALALLEKSMQDAPSDERLRIAYFRTRDTLVAQALGMADRARLSGNLAELENQLRLALKLDPQQARAKNMLADLDNARRRTARLQDAEKKLNADDLSGAESIVRTVLAEVPGDTNARSLLRRIDEKSAQKSLQDSTIIKGPFSKPITLEFRDTPLRAVFEAISRTAGINFVFDKDVRSDAKVTVFVKNSTIDEIIRLVLVTNQLERKILNENSVLIYPAVAAKKQDYQELVTRSFHLANTDVKQAQALIKQMVKTKDIFTDERLNLMVIKDTPDAVRLAERLIQTLDVADPEVTLDVEVLEVSRTRLRELGLQFPEQIGYGLLQPTTTTSTITGTGLATTSTNLGGQLLQGNIDLRHTSQMAPYIPNPGVLLNLKDQNGDSNILANPRIRVKNREKAKVHIGDKLPVFTTTSTANVGVSASVNYLDVGLKLDVQPIVHLDDEVEMNVGLEVSSIVKEVTGPQSSLAYQIGSRSATTTLRLRDGETQILAGLISDEERNSGSHLPGLGNLPVLGRLFSNERGSTSKTEIVLLITPHVVRNLMPPPLALATQSAGTDGNVGAAPMLITAAPRSLEVKGANTGTAAPTVAPPARLRRPGEEAEPATANLVLSVSPAQAAPGGIVTLAVTAQVSAPIRESEINLAFDNAVFEPADPGGGNALTLNTNGNTGTAQLRLRVKITAPAGVSAISVQDAKINVDGSSAGLGETAPVSVSVVRP